MDKTLTSQNAATIEGESTVKCSSFVLGQPFLVGIPNHLEGSLSQDNLFVLCSENQISEMYFPVRYLHAFASHFVAIC